MITGQAPELIWSFTSASAASTYAVFSRSERSLCCRERARIAAARFIMAAGTQGVCQGPPGTISDAKMSSLCPLLDQNPILVALHVGLSWGVLGWCPSVERRRA